MKLLPDDIQEALRGEELEEALSLLLHPDIAAQTYPLLAEALDRACDFLGAYEERTNAKH